MPYTLQAIIGDATMLRANCPAVAAVVALPQGKGMIPLGRKLLQLLDPDPMPMKEVPFLPLLGDENVLPEQFTRFVSNFIKRGKFVYVEAEFFGGDGTQACVIWDAQGNSSSPLEEAHAINKALQSLGVQAGNHHDEFDALELGKFRSTEAWEDCVLAE